jgi:hypothetical protein
LVLGYPGFGEENSLEHSALVPPSTRLFSDLAKRCAAFAPLNRFEAGANLSHQLLVVGDTRKHLIA